MAGRRGRDVKTGVIMDNRKIIDLGSLVAEFNQEAASKIGKRFQENHTNQGKNETRSAETTEYEDTDRIYDYDAAYQELCHILDNIKQNWGTDNIECNLNNTYYQRDLLYLYDRITMDMNYLNGYPDRNMEWLEKLLELKYEIRNLL